MCSWNLLLAALGCNDTANGSCQSYQQILGKTMAAIAKIAATKIYILRCAATDNFQDLARFLQQIYISSIACSAFCMTLARKRCRRNSASEGGAGSSRFFVFLCLSRSSSAAALPSSSEVVPWDE